MRHDVAIKWTDMLRSGQYAQGKGQLFDGEKYCCLGVLCLAVGLEFEKRGEGADDVRYYAISNGVSDGYLTPGSVVCELAGLRNDCGAIGSGDTKFADLTVLNDNGLSFKAIADLIEMHWEVL